jgi:hypothetical protein
VEDDKFRLGFNHCLGSEDMFVLDLLVIVFSIIQSENIVRKPAWKYSFQGERLLRSGSQDFGSLESILRGFYESCVSWPE